MHPVKAADQSYTSIYQCIKQLFQFFHLKTFLPLLYKQSCHQYGAALLDLIHNTLELFIELWK